MYKYNKTKLKSSAYFYYDFSSLLSRGDYLTEKLGIKVEFVTKDAVLGASCDLKLNEIYGSATGNRTL